MCGITTGGREECWWDCQIFITGANARPGEYSSIFNNLDCLEDCPTPNGCLNSLLEDYRAAGGICRDSFLDTTYPGLYPVSDTSCKIEEGIISKGLCSARTQKLLANRKNCINPLFSEKIEILRTVNDVIQSLCNDTTWLEFNNPGKKKRNYEKNLLKLRRNQDEKLNPTNFKNHPYLL